MQVGSRSFHRDLRAMRPVELARRLALQAQDSEAALGFRVRDVVAIGRLPHRAAMSAGINRHDHDACGIRARRRSKRRP